MQILDVKLDRWAVRDLGQVHVEILALPRLEEQHLETARQLLSIAGGKKGTVASG